MSKKNESPKSYLHNRLYDNIDNLRKKKRCKVKENDFIILEFRDYNDILNYNYNVNQLKRIARKYKQKVTGNKNQLIFRLYNFLKYSFYANNIQAIFRGYLSRIIQNNKNKAIICVNDTDFFTLESLEKIKNKEFFMFRENGFNYGFNIRSIYHLIRQGDKPLNPYTRKEIPEKIIKKIKSFVRVSKIWDKGENLEIEKINQELTDAKKHELEVISVFQKIDNLNHITNPNWFLFLNKFRLIRFYRELIDIWSYRLQIEGEVKRNIIPPHGKPFPSNINFHNLSLLKTKKFMIKIINDFVSLGTADNYKSLGAYYVLGALTLVSQNAASSMPWLFESFYHTPSQG
jgi:hypothetical protein